MGFHMEEEYVADGTIDNRVKGKTVISIRFINHTSSIITLRGNPCRDLAGSLWAFHNPHARMEEMPGEPCHFIPPLCEGTVGRITHTRKRDIPILPPAEHYDRFFDPNQENPPTRRAPILELEWFSEEFGQVEIDCECMTLELLEMEWSMSAEEAAAEKIVVDQTRNDNHRSENDVIDFDEGAEPFYEWFDEDPEPHELEELCFLIVQHFMIHSDNGSKQMRELHAKLLELQEKIGEAFIHLDYDGDFTDIPETISLLKGVIPFIDRANESAKFITESLSESLLDLREGILRLRDELSESDH